MASLNQCNFIGRCGQDPEIINTTNGDAVAKVSIACSEQWTDKSGNKKESTEWVNIEAWGKLAEIFEKYVKKGDLIFVSGKFKTDVFEKDGTKRYSTKISVREMKMLGSKSDSQTQQRDHNVGKTPETDQYQEDDSDDSNLPF